MTGRFRPIIHWNFPTTRYQIDKAAERATKSKENENDKRNKFSHNKS